LDEYRGLRELRRLRLVGVVAPVAFLAACEAVRIFVIDAFLEPPASNLAMATVGGVAAVGFGLLVFFHIDRAQRDLVRHSRDLDVAKRVSVAIQGELDVDAALRGGLRTLADAIGATEAVAKIRPVDPESGADREVTYAPPDRAQDALAGPLQPVELSLTASGTALGHLVLHVPASRVDAVPAPAVLRSIADELATAVHIGQLVADLHSRRADGHVFYQALVQTSNQAPLAVSIATIVDGARSRLAADGSRICLTRSVIAALELEPSDEDGITGGVACQARGGEVGSAESAVEAWLHACEMQRPEAMAAVLRAPLWASGELIGELWVARRTGPAFTERDRRYLLSLAGIATIAVVGARARRQERLGAALAERDRIARELHDSLAQVLGSTHLRLRHLLAGPALEGRPGVVAELESMADIAEEAYRDVREAILGLREASRPRDFLEALSAYVDKYAMLSGIDVQLETSTSHHPKISARGEIQVLRVVQEALTNVRKHANARSVRVRVQDASPEQLMVVVEDDGRGFEADDVHIHRDGGYGLQTMRERMELAGGSLRVDSSRDRGTRVIAIVPTASSGHPPAILADHR